MSPLDLERLRNNRLLHRVWSGLGRPDGHVVGGFVRDSLLGLATTDLDLSLPGDAAAVAAAARRLAEELGTREHLLGKPPRCVWRIETGDLKVDLWPLGELTLDQDPLRRDFACNALAWTLPEGPLIDSVAGLDDLRHRRLRAISPDNLIRDPLRLLRGPRFVATLPGFELEARTTRWIRQLSHRLTDTPRERIGYELGQLVCGPSFATGLTRVIDLGLVKPTAPTGVVPDTQWLRCSILAADLLANSRRHPVPSAVHDGGEAARLALFVRAWHPVRDEQLADYGWPRDLRRGASRAARLIDAARTAVEAPIADRRELIHTAGPDFAAVLAASAALHPEPRHAWRRWWRLWRTRGDTLIQPAPLLSPAEICRLAGIEPGPALGELIAGLRRAQLRRVIRSPAGARRWIMRRSTPELPSATG